MKHTPLGSGGEFDRIRELLRTWGPVAQGVGDDAAILTPPAGEQLVVSTDSTVEDVHFRRKWISPRDAGIRAASAALSDIAAMGARAAAVLVSLVVPLVWREHLNEFAEGLGYAVAQAGAYIVGGNMSRGEGFSCTLTVLGYAASPVRRSGGTPGDLLYVTGTLGGPGAAVAAWEHAALPEPWALKRFIQPIPRLAEGQWLAQQGARAMIDISDGLAADARHLSAASSAFAKLDAAAIPRFTQVSAEQAMSSGEEYELLVALSALDGARIAVEFEQRFGLPLTCVGRLQSQDEVEATDAMQAFSNASTQRADAVVGHDHFPA